MNIEQVIQFLRNRRDILKQSVRVDIADGQEVDFDNDKRIKLVRSINRFIRDLIEFERS